MKLVRVNSQENTHEQKDVSPLILRCPPKLLAAAGSVRLSLWRRWMYRRIPILNVSFDTICSLHSQITQDERED